MEKAVVKGKDVTGKRSSNNKKPHQCSVGIIRISLLIAYCIALRLIIISLTVLTVITILLIPISTCIIVPVRLVSLSACIVVSTRLVALV
jgi:hypothetical protein